MVELREINKAKNRLLAHYHKVYGKDIFPIEENATAESIQSMIKELGIADDEFLINEYIISYSFSLLITSARLIFKKDSILLSIRHTNVVAVYLDFPFKKETPPHNLNLIAEDKLYEIEFIDVPSLVNARNEIYRVIDTVILNWSGKHFNINTINLSNFSLIRLPIALIK